MPHSDADRRWAKPWRAWSRTRLLRPITLQVLALLLLCVSLTAIWFAPFSQGYLMGDDLAQDLYFGQHDLGSIIRSALFEAPTDRYRPVYTLAAFLENTAFGGSYTLYWVTNILLLAANATLLGVLCGYLSKSRLAAVLFALSACIAQFTWYHALQALGLMENLSVTLLLLVLALALRTIHRSSTKTATATLVALALLSLTNERFTLVALAVAVALLIAFWKLPWTARSAWALSPIAVALAISAWKFWGIGAGTTSAGAGGGALNLDFSQGLETMKLAGLAVMGFNIGPAHLAVIDSRATGLVGFLPMAAFVGGGLLALGGALFYGLRRSVGRFLSAAVLGTLLLTASGIAIATATRLEWRWIYAPFLCALIIVAWLVGEIPPAHRWRIVPAVLVALSSIMVSVAVRANVENLYLVQGQRAVQSLAWQLENDPPDVLKRTTYLIDAAPVPVFADWYLFGGHFLSLYHLPNADVRISREIHTAGLTTPSGSRPRLKILTVTPASAYPIYVGPTALAKRALSERLQAHP